MNEITIHGHLGAAPKISHSKTNNTAIVTFSVAVSDGYYDRARNRWVDRPTVWHNVVVFGELANHAFDSLAKGAAVTVTGTFSDDSYTRESREPGGEDIVIRRTKLIATDVAVSLRKATVVITRAARDDTTVRDDTTARDAAPAAGAPAA